MEEELAVSFHEAADYVQAMGSELDQDALLYLYGRYKQITVGQCNTSRPGFFDFQAKKKWDAWKALGTLSKAMAMSEYIAKVEQCDPGWRTECGKTTGVGVTVSRMARDDDSDNETGDENIFDLCKQGRLMDLKERYKQRPDEADQNKRTLLHWACDRGHAGIVEFLIAESSNVDARDEDQLTPLHYATQCGYTGIVNMLVISGADPTLPDTDGDTPLDCAESEEIKQILTAAAHSWACR